VYPDLKKSNCNKHIMNLLKCKDGLNAVDEKTMFFDFYVFAGRRMALYCEI